MTTLSWQSIQAEALRRIQTREWPPGAQIPHEADLATELGCARATVNRALRNLASAGLLDRKRKAGTRVPLNPVRKATFDIPIIRLDVKARGLPYAYRLLSQTTTAPPPDVARRLNLPSITPMIHLLALHLADNAPFCLENRWINPAATPDIYSADLTQISANEWLVQNAAFSRGDVALSAIAAPESTARHLTCPHGAPLFTVDRTTWAATTPITCVRLSYAPGYQMHAEL
jgi:GntR family histidine utilization transcriptional repressor